MLKTRQMLKENMISVLKTSPWKTISILIFGWIFMVVLTYLINKHLFFTGTRLTFPISVVYFSPFKPLGILSAFVFLFSGFWLLQNYRKLNLLQLILSYFIIIFIANFSQGSFYDGFLKPFLATDFQYYHDAILIENGETFIREFNEQQTHLKMHTKTHPPFITWLHYFVLKISGNSPAILALVFSIIGVSAVFPLIGILKNLHVFREKLNLLVLIFAFIPAVNIYSIVSVDGIFLTFSLIFLYGILKIYTSAKLDLFGLWCMFLGLLLTNLTSFGGTFLLAFMFLLSFHQIYKKRDFTLLKANILALSGIVLVLISFYYLLDYNHIQAFLTASHLENPDGFRGFHQPWIYFFTRVECVSEILLFLSFGFFAYLLHPKFWQEIKIKDLLPISLAAFTALLMMFVTGAYGTGEAARACVFIYPFFLLLLVRQQNLQILTNIAFIALFQSFGMQLIGDYFF